MKTFQEKILGIYWLLMRCMFASMDIIHLFVPSDKKCVGSATEFNEKNGCTLMVIMYKSIVLPNSNYWMLAETNV